MKSPRLVVSARARIIGWVLGLIALALGSSVLITWELLGLRSDGLADAELSHEARKFRAFAASDAGVRYRRTDQLLARWLKDNLPDTYEAYFSTVDGRPHLRSQGVPPARLDRDPVFLARVARATGPEHGWVESSAGRVRYGILPVRVECDDRPANLVVLEFRDILARPIHDTAKVFAIVAFCSLAVAATASWLVAGKVLAPIRHVRSTAERISESDLRQRIAVAGNDEVAQVARTFNHMLDRLDLAFSAQRQFLDDAGHELRTPITIIRGHLELLSDDPQERQETTALLLDELNRMNRIVEDLLVLAKAERPDFLTWGQVNLTDLTVDVVAKAGGLARRGWAVDQVADATIAADGQRLTQALMQLLANAVKHTEDGDRIAVGSEVVDDRVLLWVADTGTGVALADGRRIFDRFARGEDARRTEGAGLGLAIVRSIAQSHGGEVRLSDTPGGGATFVLDLPLRSVDPNPAQNPHREVST